MTATINSTQALAAISGLGIPTNSANAAGIFMNQNLPSIPEAKELIKTVTGGHSCSERGKDKKYVPYVASYLVMNTVREAAQAEMLNMFEALKKAKEDADNLLSSGNAWMFKEDKKPAEINVDSLSEVEINTIKSGEAKKGARKALALKIFNEEIKPTMNWNEEKQRFEFDKEDKGARKAAIALLMERVGLTDNGGSTYVANFSSLKWC